MTLSAPTRGRPGRIVTLMYHNIYQDDREFSDIDAADRPYAVSLADFRRQLDGLERAGLCVIDPRDLSQKVPADGGVVLTFDDGHGSNHRHAWPELQRRGFAAAFFATTDFIDKRSGFCNWLQLREMAEAGMTIGSHGCTHYFFDGLSESEARAEFSGSRSLIEQNVGCRVDQISFPGGRHTSRQLAWGREAGYRLLHTSNIGSHAARPFVVGATVCRLAVKAGTKLDYVISAARAEPSTLWPAQIAAAAKQSLRRAVGNRLYHALYERLAG